MFKIKVGLKSFQPDSIEKCKHQIGRIVDYLKESPASSSMFSEKDCGLSNKVRNTINWKGIPNSSIHSIETSSIHSIETSSTHGIKTTSLSGLKRENSLFDVLVCLTKLKEKKKLKTKKEKGKILHFALHFAKQNVQNVQNVTMQKIEEVAPTFSESGFIVKRASNSRSILARQIYLRDPTFYKEGIPRTLVYKLDVRGPRLRRRVPCDILQSKILFSVKSKENERTVNRLLKQEGGDVNKVLNRKKLTSVKGLFGVTPLPTLVKKITTLRSPHIDKKSREQFEWKREKAQIYFHLNSVPQISLVLFVLTHSRFPGVEVEIGVESKTYFA